MVVHRLERVRARFADLASYVLRYVELGLHLRVSTAPLVVGVARAVSVVLSDDEERSLDDEAKIAMFERAAVSFSHQEPNQPAVLLRQLVGRLVKGDTSAVDDGQVGGESSVQRDEAVIEDGYDVVG